VARRAIVNVQAGANMAEKRLNPACGVISGRVAHRDFLLIRQLLGHIGVT
jgi:hypothetical protein